MNLTWILSPLTTYAAIAAAMILTLILFVSAKVELARLEHTSSESRDSVDRAMQEMSMGLEELRTEVNAPAPACVPAGAGPALNLTKRAQALRMLHRGESVESIASALRAPRNEIELLVKLQQLPRQPLT